MAPLIPLHIVSSYSRDEFLFLLVPATIVIGIALEKRRMARSLRGHGHDESPPACAESSQVQVEETVAGDRDEVAYPASRRADKRARRGRGAW